MILGILGISSNSPNGVSSYSLSDSIKFTKLTNQLSKYGVQDSVAKSTLNALKKGLIDPKLVENLTNNLSSGKISGALAGNLLKLRYQ